MICLPADQSYKISRFFPAKKNLTTAASFDRHTLALTKWTAEGCAYSSIGYMKEDVNELHVFLLLYNFQFSFYSFCIK